MKRRRFGSSQKHKNPNYSVSGRSETVFFCCIFFFLRTTKGRKKKRTCFCLGPAVSDLCGSGPAVIDLQERFEISSNLCIFGLSKIWTLGVQKDGFFVGFFGVQIWVAALWFFFFALREISKFLLLVFLLSVICRAPFL